MTIVISIQINTLDTNGQESHRSLNETLHRTQSDGVCCGLKLQRGGLYQTW